MPLRRHLSAPQGLPAVTQGFCNVNTGDLFLTIEVGESNGCLRLSVEDNGDGPLLPRKPVKSTGTGLRNTSERLHTLYQEDARLTMETAQSRGCRVTILIPQRGHQEAA